MRADANKIALRVVRDVLEAARPDTVDVGGKAVSYALKSGPTEPWPDATLAGLDKAAVGAWPKALDVDCTWEGGRCTLRIECTYWKDNSRYRHRVAIRAHVRDRRAELLWITVPNAIGDAEDGAIVKIRASVSTFKRRAEGETDATANRFNEALHELLEESKLPLLSDSAAEVCEFEVPAGAVRPSGEVAFKRLVQVALLKLEFVDRGPEARSSGLPLVDLRRWDLRAEQLPFTAPEEVASEEDTPESSARGRRYWAGGFGEPARLKEFVAGNFWQIAWGRDAKEHAAQRTWKRFAEVRPGDLFAIKGYGGSHQLQVHFVGEVKAVDYEKGRLELKRHDTTLFRGEAPRGAEAGPWRDTLVPIKRADTIESLFGVREQPPAVEAPPLGLARNLILYGPPGTGKTFRLRDHLMPIFTRSEDKRPGARLDRVADLRWYEVIALALHALGGRAKVDALVEQPFIKARYAAANIPTALRQIVWGRLGNHTVESSTTVKTTSRHGERLFDKEKDGTWKLVVPLPDDLAEVARELTAPVTPGTADNYTLVTFHQAYGYEDFIEGIRPRVTESNDEEPASLAYRLEDGVFKRAVREAIRLAGFTGTLDEFCRISRAERARLLEKAPPYAVFIDEINRGNVARIFGELITLLEPDKRLGAENELVVTLPASGSRFGVPNNLYVVGTMNTADRSVEALDAALRRMFDFEELAPQPEQLAGIEMEGGVNLVELLRAINRRLEKLIDRDHTLGHAYFMPLEDDPTLAGLQRVFKSKVLPLLTEYFFGDWGKIGLVLGGDFIRRRDAANTRFATFDHPDRELLSERPTWELADVGSLTNLAFRRVYEHVE